MSKHQAVGSSLSFMHKQKLLSLGGGDYFLPVAESVYEKSLLKPEYFLQRHWLLCKLYNQKTKWANLTYGPGNILPYTKFSLWSLTIFRILKIAYEQNWVIIIVGWKREISQWIESWSLPTQFYLYNNKLESGWREFYHLHTLTLTWMIMSVLV